MDEDAVRDHINNLYSPVDEKLVLTVTKAGAVFIGGVQADKAQLANLKSEAEFLMQSSLWKVMNESVKELAHRAMFVAGESLDDMKKGRSILYMLDSQNRMLQVLKSFIPTKPITPIAKG